MKHFNKLKKALLPICLMLFGVFSAFAQPLNGTYTIGGTSPNYADLSTAVTALNNNGVSGPVIFNIRSGSYSGSNWVGSINSITGASATNTVTFQPESGAGTVTLAFAGTSSTNYIFRLNNASYVTIKDLTLSNTGTTYGTDVMLVGSASNNTVNNCVLTGNTGTSTSTNKARVYASGNTGSNNTFTNNTFPAGSGYAFYLYGSSSPRPSNTVIANNTIDAYYSAVYSFYNDDLKIRNNTITKNTSGAFYNIYLYECDSALEITNNTITGSSINSTTYGIYRYYCDGSAAKRQKITGNSMTLSSTSTMYALNFYYSNYDSIANNNFVATSSSAVYSYLNMYGNYTKVLNNTITLTSTGSSAYLYSQYNYNYDISYNKITVKSNSAAYGLYAYNYSGSNTNGIISNNNIVAIGSSSTVYGLYNYYGSGMRIFNNTIYTRGSSTCYTYIAGYNMADNYLYNNTLVNGGTSTSTTGNVTLYAYNYSYYGAKTYYTNNVISKTSSNGTLLYLYSGTPNMGDLQVFDYNNLYTPGANFAYSAYSGTISSNFPAYRTASGNDRNSLSYPPAFMNVTNGDLMPNPADSNCWSMHGRGIHIAGNDKDISGNTRPITPGAGVPDLGAYEFTPNSGVLPPLAQVNVAPSAGGTQVYTFGYDSVATITWDASATVPATSPECRQYSGVQPPSITTLNPTYMYFYTDISSSTSADYDANIYYKDPWIGTIASDMVLHLAKKDGVNPWVGYPIAVSGANTVRNFIYSPTSPKLNTYGWYTGIDVANNAGTDAIVTPSGFFCAGTYPVTVRIKNNGNNPLTSVKIHWQLNGGPVTTINYTNTIPVNTGVPNSNAANIFLANVTFNTAANVFKVWTSDPNGVLDVIPADDTLNISLRAALNGTYTIGGTSPDFANVEQAVDDLNALGVCGPVVFNIRPGTYTSTKALTIRNFAGSSAVNKVVFQSENGSASSVAINWAGGSSTANAHALGFADASYITIKNVTINSTGASYAYSLNFTGSSSNDSIVGCVLNVPNSTNYYHQNIYASVGSSNENIVIMNNEINNGYFGIYWNGSSSIGTRNINVSGNTFNNFYYYGTYFYYVNGWKFNNNVLNARSTAGYGMTMYNYLTPSVPQPFECNGNKIYGINPSYGAAMYIYYPHGYLSSTLATKSKMTNNVITVVGSNYSYAGIYIFYPSNADFLNNSVSHTNTNTSGYAAYIYASYSPYNNNSVRNNAFINTGGGPALYYYAPSGTGNTSDYNNLYASGSTLAQINGTNYANYPALRAGVASLGYDQNSISYNAGFTNANTDLTPDPTNPASWSLNGRAQQSTVTSTDINGNNRPTTLAAGVPDIGAYEFEPTVAPPAAVATPATAAPGVTQVFTFGGQPVATVKWNTALALTTPLTVRQYSGRIPPANFTTISGGTHQYFYTDFIPSAIGTTYDFDLTLNYMDIWMGTIASESGLKLAHKHASTPWISYNAANSSTNATTNTIQANGVTTFGTFTGIPDGVNFSALLVPAGGKSYICSGDTVLLLASPVSGGSTTYTYEWFRNGVLIPGAASNTYAATLGGDYTVKITGTQSSTSIPVGVVVTAPPMATVGASGALTYCNGSQLQLSASSPSGILSYQWQLNGTNIPGATSQTYDVTTAGTYNLIVTNIGCSDTSTATIVNAGPINVNLGADITGCEIKNQPYILDAGYPGAKYLWSTGDTTQTIQIYKGSGTYSVFVDAGPSCQGSDAINVTINPLPTATGISYIRTNNTYIFNVAGAQNVTKVLWIFSDGTTHTANTVTKTYDGNLVAKLVIYNDCGTDTLQSVQWATNVTTTENVELEASLYPNPANEQTLLTVTGAKIEDVTILNSLGQVVYRTMLSEKAGKVALPVSSFASGRYIVRATTTEGIISKPLNIQR